MTAIRINLIMYLLCVLALCTVTQTAVASEVSGVLSSDGATEEVRKETVVRTQDKGVSGQPVTAEPSSGQLQGSVIGGREGGAAVSFANLSSRSVVTWTVSLAVTILAALAYLFWRRTTV